MPELAQLLPDRSPRAAGKRVCFRWQGPQCSLRRLRGLAASRVIEDKPDAREAFILQERIDLRADALMSLSPRCREIPIPQQVKGHAQDEVADQLGVSARTVEARGRTGVAHPGTVTLRLAPVGLTRTLTHVLASPASGAPAVLFPISVTSMLELARSLPDRSPRAAGQQVCLR